MSPFRRRRGIFRFRRRRIRAVPVIPTLMTLGNGICGVLAILTATEGRFATAAVFVFAGMVLDALDGQVARATRSTSRFGGQLDSLCDLVAFGAAPAVIAVLLCREGAIGGYSDRVIVAAGCFYFGGAALRLARFNVETDAAVVTHREFHGLPTPGAAGTLVSAVLCGTAADSAWLRHILISVLPLAMLGLGLLMVSRFRYPHVVNQIVQGEQRVLRIVELGVFAVVLGMLRERALAVLFVAYAMVGPIGWVVWRLRRRGAVAEPAASAGQENAISP